jgi:hypothetical protein
MLRSLLVTMHQNTVIRAIRAMTMRHVVRVPRDDRLEHVGGGRLGVAHHGALSCVGWRKGTSWRKTRHDKLLGHETPERST